MPWSRHGLRCRRARSTPGLTAAAAGTWQLVDMLPNLRQNTALVAEDITLVDVLLELVRRQPPALHKSMRHINVHT